LQIELIGRALTGEARAYVGPRLSSAGRQVNRLGALVESLLDVSRISTGRMKLELSKVDLNQLVREIIERLKEVFAQASCEVMVEAPDAVVGEWDAFRLDQVIVNLLTNAAKYGQGRPVRVKVWGERDAAFLQVRDEGIGIAPEHLGRIFGRFERAVSDRHYGGLGLGLYISQQIVVALGGKIRVMSAPNQGATFEVMLPLAPMQRVAEDVPARPPEEGKARQETTACGAENRRMAALRMPVPKECGGKSQPPPDVDDFMKQLPRAARSDGFLPRWRPVGWVIQRRWVRFDRVSTDRRASRAPATAHRARLPRPTRLPALVAARRAGSLPGARSSRDPPVWFRARPCASRPARSLAECHPALAAPCS
jgi:two-component sensor histidine kinase